MIDTILTGGIFRYEYAILLKMDFPEPLQTLVILKQKQVSLWGWSCLPLVLWVYVCSWLQSIPTSPA